MKETKQIGKIFLPEFQQILDNESLFSFDEVLNAKKQARIESEEASRKNITVDELRLEKQVARQLIASRIKEQETAQNQLQSVDLKTFGDKCFEYIIETCRRTGSEFNKGDKQSIEMYREIIRYFYWDGDCEKLDKKRYLYLFGVYGCGKTICVEAILKAMKYFLHNEWTYFDMPKLTNKLFSQGKEEPNPFDLLFACKNNMVVNEIGDKSEKLKYYGNEIEQVRLFLLEKCDKINGSQRIVFTSNVFPDKEYFFTKRDDDIRPTLKNFYDDKIYNKMSASCNFVRFPNVSYRTNNKIELL